MAGNQKYLHTEEFMVGSLTQRCPDPVAVKQAQVMTPPPPCFDSSYEVFVLLFCIMWIMTKQQVMVV